MSALDDPNFLPDLLDGVLAVISNALIAAGRPIDRVFISPGPASGDCSQLACWSQTRVVNPGTLTDLKPIRSPIRHAVDVNVLLTRCISSAAEGMPGAAAIEVDGRGFATDMFTLQRALTLGVQTGTLGLGNCTVARLNPVIPQPPQGGLSGMTTILEVALA